MDSDDGEDGRGEEEEEENLVGKEWLFFSIMN